MTNTSHQRKLKNILESPQIVSENGLSMEKLKVSDQMEQEDCIVPKILINSLELQNQLLIVQQSVMPESVAIIKKKILKDKSNCCNQNIQMQKLSKISDQGLIGKERVLQPFWNQYTAEISTQLWSPIKTDCVDLETNLLNGSSKKLMLNSWFSANIKKITTPLKNCQTIYLQSLLSSLHETTDSEQDSISEKEMKSQNRKLQTQQLKAKKLQEILEKESLSEKKLRNDKEQLKISKLLKQKNNKEIKKQKAINKGIEFIDRTLKDKAGKSKHIQVYFNKEQKKIIKQWLGVTRFIYNKCLHIIKTEKISNKKYLRSKIINNSNYITDNKWMLEFNYDLRDEALSDLLKNINSNLAKGKKFDIKFKSKKDEYIQGASLSILAKYWNKKKGFYSPILNTDKIRTNEELPKILMYSSRLLKTATNKYFISLPLPLNESQVNVIKENKVLFIDPGSKIFITGYDPSGEIITWGENDIGRIARLLHYKRQLQSKYKGDKRTKIRKAILRIGEKIRNLVNDLHRKLAKWLCANYTKIYIPRLNFHKMRKLYSKEKAKLAAYSHCSFLDRLISKSREYNCKIYEIYEDYTSKTCSNCGNLKAELKGRAYNCGKCNEIFDRDINASKNMLLKYLTERASDVKIRSIEA